MSDSDQDTRGEIALHDRHAIGLQLDRGRIGLHPIGKMGWMVGIRFNMDLRHFRKQGSTTGFMKLERLELTIPGPQGNYTGHIEGWDYYKSIGNYHYYKPEKCRLLPHHTGFTTFAWLDAWDEPDPWFYFGWALRTDQLAPIGYRFWATVAYLGVNFPIEEGVRPSWVEIPPETELLGMMKPSAPSGQWRVTARISGFTVDPDVPPETYIVFRVWEGRRRCHRGILDFVKSGGRAVGDAEADWGGIHWGTKLNPGELRMLSGAAEGRSFRVIGSFFTGEIPPPEYPPNMWCVKTHPSDPPPGSLGVKAGDEFILAGPLSANVFKLVEFRETYPPGTYPAMDFDFPFTPIL